MKLEISFNHWWNSHSKEFDGIFFDIDGTLVAGGRALTGAADIVQRLRNDNFPFKLLTNDGNHSVQEKSALMRKCGLDIAPDNIVSCGMALEPVFEKLDLKGRQIYAMGLLGTPDFAELAGAIPVRDPDKIEECAAVVVGEGTYNWQKNISAVINFYIATPNRIMIVPNPDSYWPNGKNGIGVGAGSKARFVQTILREYGVKISPTYLGKPFKPIYDRALADLGRAFPNLARKPKRKRILAIGDSIFSDIRGGRARGFTTALVLTGVSNIKHAEMAKPSGTPHLVFEKLA